MKAVRPLKSNAIGILSTPAARLAEPDDRIQAASFTSPQKPLNPRINYVLCGAMAKSDADFLTRRERKSQLLALGTLLFLGGMALAGPGGLLAWGETNALLAQRQAQIAQLTAERDQLKNRVDLLNPEHADPDLSGELVRSKLNVIHPDEVVILFGEPNR
jgi:cell division protein FtsB